MFCHCGKPIFVFMNFNMPLNNTHNVSWCGATQFLVLKCRKRLPWCLSQPLLEIKTPATIMDDQKIPNNYLYSCIILFKCVWIQIAFRIDIIFIYTLIRDNLLEACAFSEGMGEEIRVEFIIDVDAVKKAGETVSIAVVLASGWNNMIWYVQH